MQQMFDRNSEKRNLNAKPGWIVQVSVIILSSIIYAAIFTFLCLQFDLLVFTNLTLIPSMIIAWFWGRKQGIFAIVLNAYLVSLVLGNITNDAPQFDLAAVIANTSYLLIVFLTGTAGKLTRRLNSEIRERMRVEEQLRKYHEQLEEMVEERTSELAVKDEKLKQIEKMEAVGQLAGGVAHDFNNQLAIILGYSEFLIKILENSQFKQYAAHIRTSGTRAADLTKQLLAFSRKSSYKPQVININSIITEVVNFLSRSMGNHISLVHVLDADIPNVWGGASLIQNAILNLAINARDAMERSGVLTIETKNIEIDEAFCTSNNVQLEHGNYVCIAVSDTGTGIDPSVKNHIFEPFFTTKIEGKGTGMGLAAVYGTVKSHQGTILVESEPGHGSTFRVLLPVTNRTKGETEEFDAEDMEESSVDGDHIFIIDENVGITEMVEVILGSLNYRISCASSRDEALRVYSELHREVDVVLLDISLSLENGLALFRMLKEINPDVTAIFSSGFIPNQQIETALSAGVCGFIQKPFTRRDLHLRIQEAIGKRKVENE
ncbi:MAG: ATP-binding protein [Chitinispirillaceae bacterium]